MFTQCPECSTIFRVTAEMLRAAQGRVRCGICSSSFNALEYLSEQAVVRTTDEPSPEDTITVEELPGTEFIELSGPADAPPAGSAEAADAFAGPGGDVAAGGAPPDAGAVPEDEHIPDTALEFHGSTSDLERVFVAASLTSPVAAVAATPTVAGPEVSDPGELERAIGEVASADFSGIEVQEEEWHWPDDGADDPSFTETNPGLVAALLAFRPAGAERPVIEPEPAPAAKRSDTIPAEDDLDRTDTYPVLVLEDGEPGALADEPPAVAAEATQEPERRPLPPPAAAPARYEAPPALLIPEELRRGPAAAEAPASPVDFAAEPSPRRWPFALGAAVLALALLAQVVHHWREGIARNPTAGPWLLRTYGALGLEVAMPTDLSAFELRQFGASSDPGQAGRLRLRASVLNRAPFAQPYPVLRLSLQDRFGSTIAARDLEAADYLPGGSRSASGLLGPSQRADAEVVFVDPGREAVGFELDVCAREGTALRCSADLPVRAP